MGFFDDLAMGLGLKEKDQDYYDRTAATIERNQGSGAAASYKKSIADDYAAAAPGGSSKKTTPSAAPPGYADAYKQAYTSMAQAGIKNIGGSPSTSYADAVKSGTVGAGYDPATGTGYTNTAGQVVQNQGPNFAQQFVKNSMLGKGLQFLGGIKDTDKIVNTVDGKPIYQRSNGTFYAYNALGLPYDVKAGEDGKAPTTLEEDPAQIAKRERMMSGMGSGDDGPAATPDLTEGTGEEEFDPCPEGYKYDEEQKMCVVDVSFVPDLPDVEPTPLLPTEVGGNYTQMPGGVPALPPLQPYPQARGLGATNLGPRSEGILQVVAGPQAPRRPSPIPSLTMPQMPPQRRA